LPTLKSGTTVGWSQVAGAAGRVAWRQAGRNRLVRASWQAARTTLVSFGRVLHLLWLQVTGVFFLVFAAGGGAACWRQYRQHGAMYGKTVLAFAFAIVFAYFGVSSFWRASRRS
jgi:hypothetical protein